MNGQLLKRSLAVVMMCLGLWSNAWGQSAVLNIGGNYTPCSWAPGTQIKQIYVTAAGPVAKARFKIVTSSPVNFVVPPNGEFDLVFSPGIQNGPMTLLIVDVPAGPSVTYSIVPATGDTEIKLIDSDGYPLHTVYECDTARMIAPYRPTPADGATDVPINQLLSYMGDANQINIGTSPDMQNAQLVCFGGDYPCALPLNPGLLTPHTTYYWQANHYCICGQVYPAHSDVFSFTTGDGPLAVEASTWGGVKAMYR